jgi:ubiquinone/menaquinone biosynthesis C-methylase UbiE
MSSIHIASKVRNKAEFYNKYWETRDATELYPWHNVVIDFLKGDLSPKEILDVGCGIGKIFQRIVAGTKVGIDLSLSAVKIACQRSDALYVYGVAENLPFRDEAFDIITFLEVIEHIDDQDACLAEISRVLKKDGLLILSFPNYCHFLWLIVRIMARVLNKPGWINLQPIDRILNYFQVKAKLAKYGMKLVRVIGSVYTPPILYNIIRKKGLSDHWKLNKFFDKLRFQFMSFHPVMVLKKVQRT